MLADLIDQTKKKTRELYSIETEMPHTRKSAKKVIKKQLIFYETSMGV